jgi:hypothetical protein
MFNEKLGRNQNLEMHVLYEILFKQNKWMHDLELYSKTYSENNHNLRLFILRCQIMLSKIIFWTNQT